MNLTVKSAEIREGDGRKSVWISGSEDGWVTSQALCDIHEVSGVLVLMSPFTHKPMAVIPDMARLSGWVHSQTGVSL